MIMALLEVKGITKIFGGVVALSDLEFDVDEGQLLGVIGPNGSGKTTLFNVISGTFKPTRGQIRFRGEDITGLSAHRIAAKRISRTFQLKNLFADMTVLENMLTAYHLSYGHSNLSHFINTPGSRLEMGEAKERSIEILEYGGIEDKKDILSKHLSYGHQSALGIALALAAEPQLLLLDEPVTGMVEEDIAKAVNLIKRIQKKGVAIILVEHNMRVTMGLCDRIVALNFGRKMAEGLPSEVSKNADVIEAYLGAEDDEC